MKHFQKLRKKYQQQERHWRQRLDLQKTTITLVTITNKHSKNRKQTYQSKYWNNEAG